MKKKQMVIQFLPVFKDSQKDDAELTKQLEKKTNHFTTRKIQNEMLNIMAL